MNKSFLITAALLGAVSVMFGAFGAHALKNKISADALEIFETSVRYQFYHVFALLCTGILSQYFPGNFINWSGRLFILGMFLFCGSLYLLTYFKAAGNQQMNWLGAITPIGGLCFIGGWILLAVSCMRSF